MTHTALNRLIQKLDLAIESDNLSLVHEAKAIAEALAEEHIDQKRPSSFAHPFASLAHLRRDTLAANPMSIKLDALRERTLPPRLTIQ